jgi:hypothetical protein
MFYNKEQKAYFIIAMVTMVILIIVTFVRPANFLFEDKTDYSARQKQNEAEQKEYKKYLDSLETSQQASQQLFKELVSEEDVRKTIEAELDINQKIPRPDIPTNTLQTIEQTGQDVLVEYFTKVVGMTLAENEQASGVLPGLFAPGVPADTFDQLSIRQNRLVKDLRGLPVPKEALEYHKAQILAFEHYGNLIRSAQSYARNSNAISWPDVYRNYLIINDQISTANNAFAKLNNKYNFSAILNKNFAATSVDSNLVPTAEAVFGIGDTTIVVGNIPEAIWRAVREALARAFARFAIETLDKLVSSIESNFAIASQLYYSEALGQVYVNEYLNKHVNNPLDKDIIKRFIPEFFCLPQNREELTAIFTGKAKEYLGFDPTTLDPSDPDFYIKLAKSGNYLASPDGQELYYRDLANQAASAASDAATKEVLSPGLKSPRDLVNNQITKTLSSIFNTQAAAISGSISLGTNNVENIVGQMVAGIIENLLNKFVFSGAVLQEQAVCLSIPSSKPVIPSTPTDYEYVPPSDNPDDYPPKLPTTQTAPPSEGLR